jgi:hypothetical protein
VTGRQRESDLRALERHYTLRAAVYDECHPHQRAYLADDAQYAAALCGRRSGKTEADARLIGLALEAAGADEWVTYAAVTRGLAKDLIWSRLVQFCERHELAWTMREHEGLIQTPRGGAFRLFGFDKLPELEKLRGYKVRCAIFDEPATYASHLRKIVTESVGPALGDVRGKLRINGTPGPVCAGYWFEASTGRVGKFCSRKFSLHHWTAVENTKFPRDPREWFDEEKRENGWTDESATFRREYLAEWVDDPEALVYAFVGARNLRAAPCVTSDWLITLGVDFGLRNECAWTVLGSDPHSRETYALASRKVENLIPDEAAEHTREYVERYRPSKIVGDAGGLGAPYIETYNRRYGQRAGHFMHPADKLGKRGHIDALNGDLRVPRLWIDPEACSDLVDEIQHLPWKDEWRKEEHPNYPNHCTDSLLYSHTCHVSYWHEAAPPPKTQEESWEARDLERFQATQRSAWHED